MQSNKFKGNRDYFIYFYVFRWFYHLYILWEVFSLLISFIDRVFNLFLIIIMTFLKNVLSFMELEIPIEAVEL